MSKAHEAPNRAARRKAEAEARKAKTDAHLAIQFDKLDFSNPDIGEGIVEIMENAHRVVIKFLDDLDEMLEHESVIVGHVTLLFAPEQAMIGEAFAVAQVFAEEVHPVAKYFHMCALYDLDGETTHEIAYRFISARDQVEEHLMSIILVVKTLDGGYGNEAYENFNKAVLFKHLHALFDTIGLPRKATS